MSLRLPSRHYRREGGSFEGRDVPSREGGASKDLCGKNQERKRREREGKTNEN